MKRNITNKRPIIYGVIILLPLNILAFYLVQKTLTIDAVFEDIDEQKAVTSIQQKSIFYN